MLGASDLHFIGQILEERTRSFVSNLVHYVLKGNYFVHPVELVLGLQRRINDLAQGDLFDESVGVNDNGDLLFGSVLH